MTVLRYLYASIRETLPSTTDEAGIFVAGMAWSFLLFFSSLLFFTWLGCSTIRGGC